MIRDERLTYRQFEFLMTALGYSPARTAETEGRVWKNEPFDALKYLPNASPEEQVPYPHLVTLRKVSVEKGIVEEEEFNRLLETARQREVTASVSHAA